MRALNAAWPGITDCTNHSARLRRSVWSIPRSDFRGAAAFRTSRLARCPASDEKPYPIFTIIHVGLVVEQLRCITNGQSTDAAFLLRVKEHYTRLLPDYPRFEIAESFFNSVYCRLFDHRSLTPERLFIFSSQPERRFRTIPRPLAKDFFPDTGWEWLLTRVLSDLPCVCRAEQTSGYPLHHRTPDRNAGGGCVAAQSFAGGERTVLSQQGRLAGREVDYPFRDAAVFTANSPY